MAEGGSDKEAGRSHGRGEEHDQFLLPATDRTKRFRSSSTVAQALKNIPELQKEVQMLTQTKDRLSSSSSSSTPSYSVEASMQLGNEEILVQISTLRSLHTIPISEVMKELEEEDGLLIMDVSSSELYTGRIFHRIHIKAEAKREINCELLREKILNLCQKWEMSDEV